MTGPQLDPLTIVLPAAGTATPGPPSGPRLAPPAASLGDALDAASQSAGRAAVDDRLTAAMRGAAEALGFHEAELWLLDDATVRLNRRVAWRSESIDTADTDATRDLAESAADVTVLAGSAVVIETASDARQLGIHRETGSAVCVPIATDLTIHGVLWFFGQARRVDDRVVELAEIVAGRMAVELEREALLAEQSSPAERLAERESTSLAAELPTHQLSHDELDVAGWIDTHAGVAFHDWAELEDGRVLALAGFVLDSPGIGSESSLVAAQTARVAARTLAEASADAAQLLALVNRTLWETTSSGEGVALAAAFVDPNGAGSLAAAGPTLSIRIRPDSAQSEAFEDTPLGWDLDAEFDAARFELLPNERLILAVGDPRITGPIDERALADVFRAASGDARTQSTAAASLKRLRSAGSDAVAAATAIRRR